MKKLILFFLLSSLLFIPLAAEASFDINLYYGLRNNNDVKELQEFLIDKGFLTGVSATGNFLSLTLNAVKSYQTSAGISQTGYVGVLTRVAIKNERIAVLKSQIALISQQIKDMQQEPAQPEPAPAQPEIALSSATLEINRTYFIKTAGEDFILQTFIYTIKPNPYYNKPYSHPKELHYTINEGSPVFLTEYFSNGCVENLSIPECSDNSYQHYVKPNIVIPKDSVLNIIDLPNKIGIGAFYLTSATLKGVTTGKIVILPEKMQ